MVARRVARYVRARIRSAAYVWWRQFPPILLPWSHLRVDASPVSQLRRIAAALAWARTPAVDRVWLVLFSVMWPLLAALRALPVVRGEGRFVARATGRPMLSQWKDAVRLAVRFSYDPRGYYADHMYEAGDEATAFMQITEGAELQRLELIESSSAVIDNKFTFYEECTRLGLPTAPVVAVFMPNQHERWIATESGVLPRRDLFLKWMDSEQGIGAERWVYDAVAERWIRRGVHHDHEAMVAYVRSRGSRRGMLVQHALKNHSTVHALSGDTLSTLRVVSYRDPGSPATFVRAVSKVAQPGAEIDNVNAGGLACAVDRETGMLRAPRTLPSVGRITHHPATGVPIAGVRLEVARDAIDLALVAHERLNVPWSVGWDVAMTPEGPVMIEGNPLWSMRGAQVPHGTPLPADFVARLLQRTLARRR